MERIKFIYERDDEFKEDTETIDICMELKDKDEEGLRDYDVCEMFDRFMSAIGFSEENVWKYFNDGYDCGSSCLK